MKTSVFQNSPCNPSSPCTQRPSAGLKGRRKDKQLTPDAGGGEKRKVIHTSRPFTILFLILKALHMVILVRVSISQTFITSIPLRLHAALAFFLSVLNTSLSSSLLFHLSSSKWGIISFSIFPRSCPLLPYSTSIIPPSRRSYWSGREESRRTCLFINVSEGSG